MRFEDHANMPKQGNVMPYILFLTNATVTFLVSKANNHHSLCWVLFIFKMLYKYLLSVNLEKNKKYLRPSSNSSCDKINVI